MSRAGPGAARGRPRTRARGLLACCLAVAAASACAAGPTLVHGDPATGFALYRSGRLDPAALERLCREGVEEMLVLSGTAASYECRWRSERCPGLRIRYDLRQDAREPIDSGFLEIFDRWIEESRAEGRKVAVRCRHGWHRTGRLIAWYRMRFQDWDASRAREEMLEVGRMMAWHRQLEPQVEALGQHLRAEPCATAPEHCVRTGGAASQPAEFPADACPGSGSG